MNREELVIEVHKMMPPGPRKRISQGDLKKIFSLAFQAIIHASILGEEINLFRFGRFKAVLVKPKNGYFRNPYNGERVPAKPSARVNFKPGSYWKRLLKAFHRTGAQ